MLLLSNVVFSAGAGCRSRGGGRRRCGSAGCLGALSRQIYMSALELDVLHLFGELSAK